MGWTPISPWKLGHAQTLSLTAAAATFTNNVGTQTRALLLSVTGANARIAVSPAGAAAATTASTLVKTTDNPLVVGCSPGVNVSCLGSGATVSLSELTH